MKNKNIIFNKIEELEMYVNLIKNKYMLLKNASPF